MATTTTPASAAAPTDPETGSAVAREARPGHAGGVRTAVVLRGHLDVVVVPSAIGFLILNAEVREMDLVIEVRQVVLERPVADLVVAPIRVPVVIRTVAIPLVKPRLVITLELVVEADAINPGAAVGQALRFAFIGAIDLEVVFQLALAFDAIPERLAVTLVGSAMVFEQAAAFLRQRDGIFTGAGHPNRFDQPFLAEMPQIAGARIGGTIVVIPKITTGDDPKRTNGRERARFRAAQRVLAVAIADELAVHSAWQTQIASEHGTWIHVALTMVTVTFRPPCIRVSIARVLVRARGARVAPWTAAERASVIVPVT